MKTAVIFFVLFGILVACANPFYPPTDFENMKLSGGQSSTRVISGNVILR